MQLKAQLAEMIERAVEAETTLDKQTDEYNTLYRKWELADEVTKNVKAQLAERDALIERLVKAMTPCPECEASRRDQQLLLAEVMAYRKRLKSYGITPPRYVFVPVRLRGFVVVDEPVMAKDGGR